MDISREAILSIIADYDLMRVLSDIGRLLTMLTPLRAIVLSLITITASMLTSNVDPAIAQSTKIAAPSVPASWTPTYARYYAPYAIQAAGAYLPVEHLDATRTLPAQGGYRASGDYVVQSVFNGEPVTSRARKALRAWQYEFGSDSNLNCYDSTDSGCQRAIQGRWWAKSLSGGPAFHVWARTRFPHTEHEVCSEVSIAFRGTAGGLSDWLSNLNPFAGVVVDDYYYQLRRNIDGIMRKITDLDCYKRAKLTPQIVSVGHSLGGGLAQLAALAQKPTGPRIAKVFAFDSSPITGYKLVETEVRDLNAKELTIDRIRHRGEILSTYLKYAQQWPPDNSGCDPLVRVVDVDALPPGTSIQLHNMAALAAQLVELSYNGETQLAYMAPPSTRCRTRYQHRPTDEDDTVVAGRLGAARPLYASANDHGKRADQYRAAYALALEQSGSIARLARVKIHRVVLISGGHKPHTVIMMSSGHKTHTVAMMSGGHKMKKIRSANS